MPAQGHQFQDEVVEDPAQGDGPQGEGEGGGVGPGRGCRGRPLPDPRRPAEIGSEGRRAGEPGSRMPTGPWRSVASGQTAIREMD